MEDEGNSDIFHGMLIVLVLYKLQFVDLKVLFWHGILAQRKKVR